MRYSPLLIFHICCGVVGFLAGTAAVSFRKGSRRHGLSGNVFVVSMLCMSASGVLLALLMNKIGTVPGGALTFYLVATAWMTARRRESQPGLFEWGALLGILALASTIVTFGVQAAMSPTGSKYGYPPGLYFMLGSVAALALVGDIRMIARRGISGTPRVARHLWRMCFAFFIAAASIFMARQHLFPVFMRRTGMLFLLSFMPLILMIFWLIRIRVTKAYRGKTMPRAGDAHAAVLSS